MVQKLLAISLSLLNKSFNIHIILIIVLTLLNLNRMDIVVRTHLIHYID